MLSRAFVLAACVALCTADTLYSSDTARPGVCGGKEVTCVGGKMNKDLATCTYLDGTSCYLCTAVSGLSKCADPSLNTAGPHVWSDVETELTVGVATASGSGAGNGLPTTKPNAASKTTFGTYEGMGGWKDISASKFFDFRDFLLGIFAEVPSFYTQAPFTVTYECVDNQLLKPESCNIFLFTYRCPPCESRDGDIGTQLLAVNDPKWHFNSCGPTFQLDSRGMKHQFVFYSAELPKPGATSFTTQADIQFMFWGIIGKSVTCETRHTEAKCSQSDLCTWDEVAIECKPRMCPPVSFAGPSLPRCQKCVSDEEEFIPEVKF